MARPPGPPAAPTPPATPLGLEQTARAEALDRARQVLGHRSAFGSAALPAGASLELIQTARWILEGVDPGAIEAALQTAPAVSFRPGDRVLVGFRGPLTEERARRLHLEFAERLPDVEVVIVDGVRAIAVEHRDESALADNGHLQDRAPA